MVRILSAWIIVAMMLCGCRGSSGGVMDSAPAATGVAPESSLESTTVESKQPPEEVPSTPAVMPAPTEESTTTSEDDFEAPLIVDLDMSSAPLVGQTAELTCIAYSRFGVPDVVIEVVLPDGLALVSGETLWTGSIAEDSKAQFSLTVRAIQEGDWVLEAFARPKTPNPEFEIDHIGRKGLLYLRVAQDAATLSEKPFAQEAVNTDDAGGPQESDPTPSFAPPLELELTTSDPPLLNKPIDLTCAAYSPFGVPEVIIEVVLPQGFELVSGEPSWEGSLPEDGKVQFSLTVRAIQVGDWVIEASARPKQPQPNALVSHVGQAATLYLQVGEKSATISKTPPVQRDDQCVPLDDAQAPPGVRAPETGITQPEAIALANPPEVEPGEPAAPLGTLTVTGRFSYVNRSGSFQSLRWATVWVWDADSISADDYLGSCLTQTDGTFSCGPFDNVDGEGGTQDIYVQILATSTAAAVQDSSGTTYDGFTGTYSNVPDGTYNIGHWSTPTGDSEKPAWWVYENLLDGWSYFAGVASPSFSMPKQVAVWYSTSTHGTHYHPGGEIHLLAGHANDPDVILHEYGHAVMYRVYGDWMPAQDYAGAHTWWRTEGVNHAWMEGWACFVALLVFNDRTFTDTTGGFSINFESRTDSVGYTWHTGDAVDGNVGGALWDIYDSTNDGYDTLSDGLARIWDVVYYQNDNNFSDFWNAWKSRGHPKHQAVKAIYQNTIDYDTAPTLSALPNRTLSEDTVWNNAIDLKAHADDPESADSELVYTIVGNTNPSAGVTIDSMGFVDINPQANWCGSSLITIQVSDGIKQDTDSFVVTVTCVNDPPLISGLPDRSLDEDTSLNNTIDLWAYASDIETSDSGLTFAIVGNTSPSCGVSIDSNRYIDIAPAANWYGTSDVTVRVTDPQGAYNSDTFRITVRSVNDAPLISGLPDRSLDEDTSLNNTIDLWAYASDVETSDSGLTFAIVGNTNPSCGASIDSNRYIDIAPAADWYGTSDVTIRVTDPQGAYNNDTFRITVNAVNDAPVISGLPDRSLDEDTNLNNTIDLWAYASDETADSGLTFTIAGNTNPSCGVSIDNNRYIDIEPAANWYGTSDVTIQVADPQGASDTDTFRITVNAVNDAPLISGLPDKSLDEDTSLDNTIDLWAYASDVETVDSGLTFAIVGNTSPSCGVSIDSNRYIDIAPVADWYGTSDVTVRVTDPQGAYSDGTFRITVRSVNDAPVISGLPDRSLDEDTSLNNTIDLWAHASDIETTDSGLIFTISGNTNPGCGVSIDANRYIDIEPAADWYGTSDVTIQVADPDGASNTDTFRITVNAVNDAPVISGLPDRSLDEDTGLDNTIDLWAYASDVETADSGLTFAIVGNTNPSCGVSIDNNRYIDIEPVADWYGTSDVTIQVADPEGTSDTDTFRITVRSVNDAPLISGLPDKSLDEDTSLNNTIDLWAHASDIETADSGLTFTISGNTDPGCGVSIDANRYIDIEPVADWYGTSDVTVQVADPDGASNTDTFRVTVNAVNDAPLISGLPDKSLDEDTNLDNTIDLWAQASDVETSDSGLTFAVVGNTDPDCGVSIDGNRYIDIQPAANWYGSSDVTIRVTDPQGASDTDTFRITVNSVNDLPWISPVVPNQSASVDAAIAIDLTAYEHDVEDSADSLDWYVSGGEHCVVAGEYSDDDLLTFTPDAGFEGEDEITLHLVDSDGAECTQQIVLTWEIWKVYLPLVMR